MKSWIMLAALGLSLPTLAANKCQDAGQTLYSDQPCPSGTTILLPQPSAPNDAKAAQMQLAHEKEKLLTLKKSREKEEALTEKSQSRAAKKAAQHHKRCTQLALKKKWAQEDITSSSGKASIRASVRLRHAEEMHALHCSQ